MTYKKLLEKIEKLETELKALEQLKRQMEPKTPWNGENYGCS
jgi:hypothetical protein